jgi:hypothetical protein
MPTPGNASPMVSERLARAELGLPAEARYERRAVACAARRGAWDDEGRQNMDETLVEPGLLDRST